MPFSTTRQLPESVRNVLPGHAQEIYRATFNSAWDGYAAPEDRRDDDSREEVSHKVAWAAVKRSYGKDSNGRWRRRG